MKLEINSRRKTGKFTIMWKLNNTLQDNQGVEEEWIKEESKGKLENVWRQMEMKI